MMLALLLYVVAVGQTSEVGVAPRSQCHDFVSVRAEFVLLAGFGGDPVAVELHQVVRGRYQPPFG
jgi:hypothetical protein